MLRLRFEIWKYRHSPFGEIKKGDKLFTCVGPCKSNELFCRLSRFIFRGN